MSTYYGDTANIFQILSTQKLTIGTVSANVQLDADSVYRIIADVPVFLKQGGNNTVTATTGDMLLDAYQEFFINTKNGLQWLAYIGNGTGNIYITKVA